MPGPFLAHSWGWDEVLYFGIPIVGALLWVRWIEQRAAARKAAAAEEEPPGITGGDPEEPGANMARPDQS